MRGLNRFFDWGKFMEGKVLTVTSTKNWEDYDTKQLLGSKIEVVISVDQTVYPLGKDGQQVSNLYEKFFVKVPKMVNVPIGVQIVPVDATAVVYGQFQNMLSVTARDIRVVQSHTGPATGSAPSHTAQQNTGKALGKS